MPALKSLAAAAAIAASGTLAITFSIAFAGTTYAVHGAVLHDWRFSGRQGSASATKTDGRDADRFRTILLQFKALAAFDAAIESFSVPALDAKNGWYAPKLVDPKQMFGAVAQEVQPIKPPTWQAICGYKWREYLAADPSAPRGRAAFTEYRRTVCRYPSRAGSRPPASVFGNTSFPADVLRVIDGDTFEARVDVWPGLDITTKVRLRGIDAPELRARCPAEQTKAEAARDALKEIFGTRSSRRLRDFPRQIWRARGG